MASAKSPIFYRTGRRVSASREIDRTAKGKSFPLTASETLGTWYLLLRRGGEIIMPASPWSVCFHGTVVSTRLGKDPITNFPSAILARLCFPWRDIEETDDRVKRHYALTENFRANRTTIRYFSRFTSAFCSPRSHFARKLFHRGKH